jgi:hypothetical protein
LLWKFWIVLHCTLVWHVCCQALLGTELASLLICRESNSAPACSYHSELRIKSKESSPELRVMWLLQSRFSGQLAQDSVALSVLIGEWKFWQALNMGCERTW